MRVVCIISIVYYLSDHYNLNNISYRLPNFEEIYEKIFCCIDVFGLNRVREDFGY